jgi:arginyl-tRNA synthetase
MKIAINKVKQIPKGVSEKFGLCVYGILSEEINSWIQYHKMEVQNMGAYSNIYTDKKMDEIFNQSVKFQYLDGFSPNLNKHLHVGHFSNLVLAKAFKSMGVAFETLAILGDTLPGEVTKEEALETYKTYCDKFNYPIYLTFLASEMKCDDSLLELGTWEYVGTKVFEIGKNKVVGIKSDKSTSYFYQDVALASKLNASTLYLTGSEQNSHFKLLQEMFPHIQHIGLGLVKAKGAKMSSRLGNVIWMKDVLDLLKEDFGDEKLCYNIFAGLILKSSPKSDKNIDMDQIKNPLNSPGLYISYTLAKLKSAGVECKQNEVFESQELQFKYMKATSSLMPNILLDGVVDQAKKISNLYITHKIVGNEDNKIMFAKLAADLLLGISLLGMFDIDKV